MIFLRDLKRETDQEYASKQKSDQVYRSLLLLLVALSEIDARFSLGESSKLTYIGGLLLHYFDETRELYELRYQRLLTNVRGG